MRTQRLIVAPAVLAVACWSLLAAGPVALGKDNVTARLLIPLRLDAAPGEKLTVAWALAGTDEHGQRQPFNAIGVFVRLLSASGGRPTVGFATPDAYPQGRYDAQVAVPEGGIGGIQIGLGDTSEETRMADARDPNRDAEDQPGGNTSVSDLVDDDLADLDTPSESEEQDEARRSPMRRACPSHLRPLWAATMASCPSQG
jgi:hypothetical protein